VKQVSRFRGLWPVLLALACAEGAARRLTPQEAAPVRPLKPDLSRHFTSEEMARGRRFVRPQLALGLAGELLQLGLLTAAVWRTGRRADPGGDARHPVVAGALVAAGLAGGATLSGLPVAALARRRSLAVGLSTQSWRGWAADLAKAAGIEVSLAGGAGAGVTWLTRRYPRSWWLGASAGAVAVGGLTATLAPVLLEPVFNHFTPLPPGDTRADVLELASAAGVRVGEVYGVDASRRTTGANAYVSGLGPTKRVVLFDTLLERYSREQIRVVVAHELAHVRHRDVRRSLTFLALISPAAGLAVQRISWQLYPARGTPGALPALALAGALVAGPLGLIGSRLSRAVERRADLFSLRLSDAPEAFVEFQRAIAVQNVADVDPPRWVSGLLSTHPPVRERIGLALAYAQSANGAASPIPQNLRRPRTPAGS
jgi:STE24 endopeptidase